MKGAEVKPLRMKGHPKALIFPILLFLSLSAIACGTKRVASIPIPAGPEVGLASWYGKPYHGRPTASGEIYDMYKMTAAHRTLPLGTEVQVTNIQNGKRAEVRINDRGPFLPERIIDVSYAAAQKLGMIIAGVVPVHLQIVRLPFLPDRAKFTVQVGAFASQENAMNLKERLERGFSPVVIELDQTLWGPLYRVRVGKFGSEGEAILLANSLAKEGLPAMIIRLDKD